MWTNEKGVSLLMLNWLIQSNYNNELPKQYEGMKTISATSLLKPTRAIVLTSRIEPNKQQAIDVSTLIASRMGQAIHESIEQAWTHGDLSKLADAGIPKKLIESFNINPTEPTKGTNIFFEKREFKVIKDWVVSGQFDAVVAGQVIDFKSTSTFTYTAGNKDDDYSLQGSIYRWLNPELITNPVLSINFIFKDWSPIKAKITKGYPKAQVMHQTYPLLSLGETEQFILSKLNELDMYWNVDESALPKCSDKELWRGEPVYKYFSKPDATRATKVFDDLSEANMFKASKKGVGRIETFPAKARACKYCSARPLCNQYRELSLNGEIDGESN